MYARRLLLVGLLCVAGVWGAAPAASETTTSLAGRLLVAMPELQDPNFHRTVVYMVEHDDRGALGLVINRLLGKGPAGKLLGGMGIESAADIETELQIHAGGPVERNLAFLLHSPDYGRDGTVILDPLTAQVDDLVEIALERGTRQSLIAFGYAGWGAQQLEGEIARGSWFTIEADEALLFDDAITTKWERALALRGFEL